MLGLETAKESWMLKEGMIENVTGLDVSRGIVGCIRSCNYQELTKKKLNIVRYKADGK